LLAPIPANMVNQIHFASRKNNDSVRSDLALAGWSRYSKMSASAKPWPRWVPRNSACIPTPTFWSPTYGKSSSHSFLSSRTIRASQKRECLPIHWCLLLKFLDARSNIGVGTDPAASYLFVRTGKRIKESNGFRRAKR
jgi:hypothetical protein